MPSLCDSCLFYTFPLSPLSKVIVLGACLKRAGRKAETEAERSGWHCKAERWVWYRDWVNDEYSSSIRAAADNRDHRWRYPQNDIVSVGVVRVCIMHKKTLKSILLFVDRQAGKQDTHRKHKLSLSLSSHRVLVSQSHLNWAWSSVRCLSVFPLWKLPNSTYTLSFPPKPSAFSC